MSVPFVHLSVRSNYSLREGAIRPEELRLSSTRTNWCIAEGKLASRHFVSGIFLYLIALNDGSDVMVRSYQGELAVEGEGVWIEADPESCRILRD